jgi:predicted component of type VI protein secretion system
MSTDRPEACRYRLRFLLQEFDLAFGDTLIGRGDDCQITIYDPSISRHHARIVVDNERAMMEDLGSRNGCRVNGNPVKDLTELADGDRIRIGTQELVFSEMREQSQVHPHRKTGSLCFCGQCKAAYAQEMDACPHCGSTSRGESPSSSNGFEDDRTPQSRRRVASAPPRI